MHAHIIIRPYYQCALHMLKREFFIIIIMLTARVEFGFGQEDYSGDEASGVTVEVIKRDTNVGDFVVTISPLSYVQFENMGLPLPPELPIGSRPSDPAECENQ